MNPFRPLLPHQKPFGWVDVHTRDGVVQVPLTADPAQNTALIRTASRQGKFPVTVHEGTTTPAPAPPVDPDDDYDRSL